MSAASELIDERIASLRDWRGAALARMRALIHEALPAWMGMRGARSTSAKARRSMPRLSRR